MITIEQLNAIPGRPDGMEWVNESHRGTILTDESRVAYASIVDGAVAIWTVPHDDTRTLYSFATYIRRVEIEIERMGHEEKFLDGSTVCTRRDAIQYALDKLDESNEESDIVEVEITPSSRAYPDECFDLEDIGEHIVRQSNHDEDGNYPEVSWKDGASEALSVFIATYADLDPWYNGIDEETVTVRLVRNKGGFVVNWEVIE